jgi:hypothetical protein
VSVMRPELPPAPDRISGLRLDRRGYPVPWFVTWIDGEPDFRVITAEKVHRAHRLGLCWICGGLMGAWRAFVIGPMCAVNRTSGEPPSHVDCADYAARACPFLARPHMHRREKGLPEGGAFHPAGLQRNPGVALVWIIKRYGTKPTREGLLFDVGEPIETRWYAEGRAATRDEVMASIDSGMPLLRDMATQDGPAALVELARLHDAALAFLPAGGST